MPATSGPSIVWVVSSNSANSSVTEITPRPAR
jgi:hypothetical protein